MDKELNHKSILEQLSNGLYLADLYYGIGKSIRSRIPFDVNDPLKTTLLGSYYACMRETLLYISMMILPDRESLSLPYYLNYLEQNLKTIDDEDHEKLMELIKETRTKLQKLGAFAEKIKRIRDKELGHMDKKLITNPESIMPIPIENREIEECLIQLVEIINSFERQFNQILSFYPDYYKVSNEELNLLLPKR